MIQKNDILDALKRVSTTVTPMTDVVLPTNRADDKLLTNGLGSCVRLNTMHGFVGVTCEHVIREADLVYVSPDLLSTPKLPAEAGEGRVPVDIIATDSSLDLAIFKLKTESGRSEYDIVKSETVTEDFLAKEVGTAAFIAALWGDMTKGYAYSDGVFYLEMPIYSAIGPLLSVTKDMIVADFAEKEVLMRNERDFPQIKDVEPTGGRRDLSGISGSGLWMLNDQGPVLVGIVTGWVSANDEVEHHVRATPIWRVVEWLETLT